MTHGRFVKFRVLEGPNQLVPHAAAVAEFEPPSRALLPADRARAVLAELVPDRLLRLVQLPPETVSYAALAARLASALQDLRGPCDLPMDVATSATGHSRILLGYHDLQTALHALRAGLQIANEAFARAAGKPDRQHTLFALVDQIEAVMALRQPDHITRSLMRVARGRGIPVYPVSPGSRIWLYGQGSAGVQFFEAANHRDSLSGARLAGDKFLTNQLITRLGLPGVEHAVAPDLEAARRLAGQFGFPLVVKPLDRGKGRGVTANVATPEALDEAFLRAQPFSSRGVLIERFVEGDDHRLSVFGGKLQFASRRSPPRITGDGEHTVAELIELENRRRSDADVSAGFVERIAVDDDVYKMLERQRLTLQDRPAPGHRVALRSIANTATGGTVTDCTADVHPDNRELANTIARAFHMDALGIDFMTPDISRSWREVACAVLEINATPGFSSDGRAEIILREKFPSGDGRIPSVVVVDGRGPDLEPFVAGLRALGLRVGQTDASETRLGAYQRCGRSDRIPARVAALVLDPACDALVIGVSSAELERHGFPLDRCDLAVLASGNEVLASGNEVHASGSDAMTPLLRLVRSCARQVVVLQPGQSLESLAAASLASLRPAGA